MHLRCYGEGEAGPLTCVHTEPYGCYSGASEEGGRHPYPVSEHGVTLVADGYSRPQQADQREAAA